jgi:putative transposase
MITTRFTESQIVHALKDYEGGKKAEVVCRDLGITKTTFYNWKKRYSGLGVNISGDSKTGREKPKLISMYADLALDNKMLKDVLSKKW